MKLNLYSVNDKYIKYLRQFDEKVYDNKEDIRIQTKGKTKGISVVTGVYTRWVWRSIFTYNNWIPRIREI